MTPTVQLSIDGRSVTVPAGSTVLDAARRLDINIPTLCFLAGVKENRPSCMACVVRVNSDARLVPACATIALDGMVVASETPEVHAARRAALELLLGDHLGDCIPVCQRVCPARMQIPVVIRLVAAGQMREAIAAVKENVVFPGVMGRICRAACQTGCRRGKFDGPVAIQLIEREVADQDRAAATRFAPVCRPRTGKRVAIVGAGATGLSAAFFLLKSGHDCVVFDDHAEPGGTMRYGVAQADLPRAVLDAEIGLIQQMGLDFHPRTRLGRDVILAQLQEEFDAVVLAVGELAKTDPAALGVMATSRAIRVRAHSYQTSVAGVFAGGSAIRAGYDPARSVGDGRILAECVEHQLAGRPIPDLSRDFTSTIPKLSVEEYQELTKGANAALSVHDLVGVAAQAAGRCCHCDCRAANGCRLRSAAEQYGADPRAFDGPHRRRFEFIRQPAGVIFEPGKCISCGICVAIANTAREPLGLSFVGRGFDLRIRAPLDGTITDALQTVAADCVQHCPTGALAFEEPPRAPQPTRSSSASATVRATGTQVS